MIILLRNFEILIEDTQNANEKGWMIKQQWEFSQIFIFYFTCSFVYFLYTYVVYIIYIIWKCPFIFKYKLCKSIFFNFIENISFIFIDLIKQYEEIMDF